ncbi:MAG TPA: aldehyde ferredoxin oxidoreductase family protein [Chloroflexota bacterium]|nr:aldehyde ferredoxin oxidoreductase family protein [Chloroflexota bacterium]
MAYGYTGKILRLNLTTGTISVDEHDDLWYRRYLGGAGIAAYYLLNETKPGIDPLGPENKLIFAIGPLTGIPLSGASRICVGAKSPMTGGIGKSEAGGFFPAELKHAGYDAIVVEGKSEKPVYLWIKDGEVEIRDAGHLWGRGVMETEDAIKEETGEKQARVMSIGPGGEKQVRYACIIADLKDAAGRGGMGAVMGSKNLKAIAVRGHKMPETKDPETIKELAKMMAKDAPVKAKGFHDWGTGPGMPGWNLVGNLCVRNFQDAYMENLEPITAQAIKSTIRIGMEACYACAVRCKKVVKVDEPWVADPRYGGPEYETIGAFGTSTGVDNVKAIARAHHLCQHYTIDTISTGVTIAWAMECYERGIFTKADTDGLDLHFGNAEAMLKLIEMIGERRGFGNLLAEGTRVASRKVGKGSEELAMNVKGVEIAMHDPRYKQGLSIGYSVANIGGDHCGGLHDSNYEVDGPALVNDGHPLGFYEPMPVNELSTRKAFTFFQRHRWTVQQDSAVVCIFVPYTYEEHVKLINAATGWNASLEELLLTGQRAITMGRIYNVREGLTAEDDRLPKRFFSPPLKGELAKNGIAVDPEKMAECISKYYYFMGWDPKTGVPTQVTLEKLGLDWAANQLA